MNRTMITNVKGINRPVTLGRLNIIFGPNESGKTAIMHAAQLALTGRALDMGFRDDGASWATLAPLLPTGATTLHASVADDGTTTHSYSLSAGSRPKITGSGRKYTDAVRFAREHYIGTKITDKIRGVALVTRSLDALLALSSMDRAQEVRRLATNERRDWEIVYRLVPTVEAKERLAAARLAENEAEDRVLETHEAVLAHAAIASVLPPEPSGDPSGLGALRHLLYLIPHTPGPRLVSLPDRALTRSAINDLVWAADALLGPDDTLLLATTLTPWSEISNLFPVTWVDAAAARRYTTNTNGA